MTDTEQIPEQLLHDVALLTMYLSSWSEHGGTDRRFWKGFDFGILDKLAEQELITDSGRAKSAYLTDEGVRRAREILSRIAQNGYSAAAAPPGGIVRLFAGQDGQSHFEDVQLSFADGADQSQSAELVPGTGILVRRFEAGRTNPWHHAPGRYAVFTLCGAVDIGLGDGSVRRIGVGDVLIAEDLTGQGHQTREVGPEPRISVFVPLA
jgi:quercetin dioxygenase-like cupin family protein